MNYSNHQFDSVSTVQLSPFSEDQWNRIVTYSPFYVHWTDLVMMTQKQKQKSLSSKKRNFIGLIDMNTIKLEDDMLLNELQDIRKSAAIPSLTTIKEKDLYHKPKSRDEERDRRPTSPTDEYQQSSDFFYQTRVPPKLNCSYNEPSFSQQHNTK